MWPKKLCDSYTNGNLIYGFTYTTGIDFNAGELSWLEWMFCYLMPCTLVLKDMILFCGETSSTFSPTISCTSCWVTEMPDSQIDRFPDLWHIPDSNEWQHSCVLSWQRTASVMSAPLVQSRYTSIPAQSRLYGYHGSQSLMNTDCTPCSLYSLLYKSVGWPSGLEVYCYVGLTDVLWLSQGKC